MIGNNTVLQYNSYVGMYSLAWRVCISVISVLYSLCSLEGMIAEGKDKLEWYRQVDPAKLNTLKELIASPNYKVDSFTA